jgi:hypothetical protein
VELEQRIRALELEMKILKNEVQRTLLDVQEQVLLNHRPVITSESKPSGSKVQASESKRAQPPVVSAAPAAPAATLATTAPAAPVIPTVAPAPPVPAAAVALRVSATPPVPVTPVLKKVSLEEIRAAQSELDSESTVANSNGVDELVELVQRPESGPSESSNGDAATLAERGGIKLLEWLMSSATTVNGERDEKHVAEVLDKLTKLNSLVDRASTMEEALRLIEEAKLG